MQKFLLLTLLLLSDTVRAEIEIGDITIIGEIHQHAESPAFFQRLVTDALKRNSCLTIALEIYSNQQAVLDQIQAGKASPADLEISSIIDHPKYRDMIGNLAAEARNGACIRLLAIDAGDDVNMNRDRWMAKILSEQSKDTPILALLGSRHALKRVAWNDGIVSPSVSEILTNSGRTVKTYLQDWPEPCSASRAERFYDADQHIVLSVLHRLFSVMNAESPSSASGVVDGAIVWECQSSSLPAT